MVARRGRTGRSPRALRLLLRSRVEAAFAKAASLGFAWVSTSLLYSRYQPHEVIAAAGRRLAAPSGPGFVYRDFRTDWQAGIDRSKDWGLYRQPYCGCVYSEADRYRKKLERCKKEAAKHLNFYKIT